MELKIYEGGHYCHLQGYSPRDTARGKRGKVHQFSGQSRKRILAKVAQIDASKICGHPLFVTLTYPRHHTSSPKAWKRHLDILLKRYRRYNPRGVIVWRLEFQKRGAPHYHLIIFQTGKRKKLFIKRHRLWFKYAWNNIVAPADQDHLKAGTQCDKIRSWNGVFHYVAKYMGKTDQSIYNQEGGESVGRFWGIANRDLLPISFVSVDLTPKQFWFLRRQLKEVLERRTQKHVRLWNRHQGIAVFIDYDTALQMLTCLPPPETAF